MKKIILFLMVLFTTVCYAQSDFDIAQSFMSKKGVKLVDNPCRTRGVGKPYSIFTGEDNKGFAIVINGCVIGYGTEEITESDELPCGLEVLLNTYPQVTRPMMTRSEKQNYVPDWWEKEKRENLEPIGPLLTTKWNQTPPYNDSLETKTNICSRIAMAQILHYYKIPHLFGKRGEQVGDTLHVNREKGIFNYDTKTYTYIYDAISIPIEEFHHELMLDKYVEPTGKLGSNEERGAVAKYLQAFELIAGKITYLDSDKDIHNDIIGIKIEGNYFEAEGEEHGNYYWWDYWLDKKMPIYAVGNGHAFVIDGRNSEGRYHINWGWGGSLDGFFILPNTPEQCKEYLTDENKVSWLPCTISTPIVYCPLFEWTPSESTFIDNNIIFNTLHNNNVYNLKGENNGNTLNGLPKGVYIQNRKKYIVK